MKITATIKKIFEQFTATYILSDVIGKAVLFSDAVIIFCYISGFIITKPF